MTGSLKWGKKPLGLRKWEVKIPGLDGISAKGSKKSSGSKWSFLSTLGHILGPKTLENATSKMLTFPKSVTYSGCLGDQYTSLGTQTLKPKKTFQDFFFQL